MGDKSIHDFSAPLAANVATGPNVINGDANFVLKPALITMVQASPFCGKAHEDANAHLRHFLEICSTFTIKGSDPRGYTSSPFPLLFVRKG